MQILLALGYLALLGCTIVGIYGVFAVFGYVMKRTDNVILGLMAGALAFSILAGVEIAIIGPENIPRCDRKCAESDTGGEWDGR
jgi:hypothetical protein